MYANFADYVEDAYPTDSTNMLASIKVECSEISSSISYDGMSLNQDESIDAVEVPLIKTEDGKDSDINDGLQCDGDALQDCEDVIPLVELIGEIDAKLKDEDMNISDVSQHSEGMYNYNCHTYCNGADWFGVVVKSLAFPGVFN